MSLPDGYYFNSRPSRVAMAAIGWPFELPTTWRRAWLLMFPVTVPIWLVGCACVAVPLMMYVMFREIIDDIWNGTY